MFLSPWWLLALVLVPVVAAAFVLWARDRRRAAAAFADPGLLDVRARRGARWLRAAAAALVALAVGFGALAMARPAVDRTEEQRRGSVVLALDVSRSMLKDDFRPNRLAAGVDAAKRFLDAAPEEVAVGLVTFADGARVLTAPTTDRDEVRRALDAQVDVRIGTAIGDAVVAGLSSLRAAGALEPVPATPAESAGRILLLTDGAHSAGLAPELAGQRARAVRVPVYTVLIGNDAGRPDQLSPPEALAALATQTGGTFNQGTSNSTLTQVLEDLGERLAPVRRIQELTVLSVVIAIALLAAAGALMLLTLGRTEPRGRARLPA